MSVYKHDQKPTQSNASVIGRNTNKENLMIDGFGPTSFNISIGGHNISHCIQLTSTGTSGEFTMAVGQQVDGECSDAPLHDVANVTLDDENTITACTFTGRFADRNWKAMSGTFETDSTGGGAIEDDSAEITSVPGTWSAGGTGQSFGQEHKHKHGHHA